MASFLSWIFSFVLIAVWVTAGGFITEANIFIDKDKEENFGKAKMYSLIAALVTWILLGIFIILLGLAIFGVITLFGSGVGEAGLAAESIGGGLLKAGAESKLKKVGLSWFTILFLLFAVFLVTLTGVLSVLTAVNLQRSTTFSEEKQTDREQKAYLDSIIAASLSLGTVGLLLIGLATYIGVSISKKKKVARILRENAEKKAAMMERIKQRQYNQLREKEAEKVATPPPPPRTQTATTSSPPPLPPRPHSTSKVDQLVAIAKPALKPTEDKLIEAARNAVINSALSSLFTSPVPEPLD